MWGYPATPLLFVAVTVWFLGNMLVTKPGPSLASLGLMATGLPAWLIWKGRPTVKAAAPTQS
jgi:basic amino acid/polyamine antiporter, APA family